MLEELLAGGFQALGIPLPEGAPALYRAYLTALAAANREFNLTAIEAEEDAARFHILDSAALLKAAVELAGTVCALSVAMPLVMGMLKMIGGMV